MDIFVQQGDLTQISCDVLIVNLFEGVTQPGGATGAVNQALGGWLTDLLEQQQFTGKANAILDVPTFGKLPAKRVLVVGLGKAENFGLEQVRQAAGTVIKRARDLKARMVATVLHGTGAGQLAPEAAAQALVEGTLLGAYRFDKYKTKPDDIPALASLTIVEMDDGKVAKIEAGVNTGRIIGDAVNRARDLINEPPDLVTPGYLALTAQEIAAGTGLVCEVWELPRIEDERMRCLAMVGRASAHAPRFIRLDYVPEGTPVKKVCLIGKGLCYDSGGLSLKPAEFMKHMKTDMSGAAAVICGIGALAQLKPRVAVTVLVPTCENMIGGKSYKVDDVLRARNEKTIEVDNTDAEGRLVLADALSYAVEQDFDEIIDVATLTGGCIIALGRVWTGVMGNDQGLIDRVCAAGRGVGERIWPLPFDPEIRAQLDSDVADMKNTGGREASAIQGGMFLQEFAGEKPWIHMDIAGTSYIEKVRAYEPKGATGVPLRTLVAYVMGME